jgi:hypothetical protein
MTLHGMVVSALKGHRSIRSVRLVGSRQRGTATLLSDWDFAVAVADFATASAALPDLVAPLQPLVQQWDPLSRHKAYLLLLRGPVKVDLLFDEPHQQEPPWEVRADSLQLIEGHFWDWLYWLASKHHAGKLAVVAEELAKMQRHLLGPLGVSRIPDGIEQAISLYVEARQAAETRFNVTIHRDLEHEIRRGLRVAGYDP